MEKTFEQELNETFEQSINFFKSNPEMLDMYKAIFKIEGRYSDKLRIMVKPYNGSEPLVYYMACFVQFIDKFKKSEVKQILNEIVEEFKAMGYTAEYKDICKDRFTYAKTYATILNVYKFNN